MVGEKPTAVGGHRRWLKGSPRRLEGDRQQLWTTLFKLKKKSCPLTHVLHTMPRINAVTTLASPHCSSGVGDSADRRASVIAFSVGGSIMPDPQPKGPAADGARAATKQSVSSRPLAMMTEHQHKIRLGRT